MKHRHFVVLSSAYSKGKRIGLHYIITDSSTQYGLSEDIKYIMDECGNDVSISSHYIETDKPSWKSVCEKDGFFKNVELVRDRDLFVELIKKDRNLSGIDVANYILSKRRFGHVKTEKLVYYCYADYLCDTDKRLFDDKIYAFAKGPVVDSVYKKYHTKKGPLPGVHGFMSTRSRILFAEDGIEKLRSIDATLDRMIELKPEVLVALTHRASSPWDMTDKTKRFAIIDDELIKELHYIERCSLEDR